jgi:cell division transport system permease protein
VAIKLVPSSADRRLLDERRGTRAMMWIMAIMLFLTVLAGALGLATRSAASLLDRQLAGRLTVQILAPVERDRAREAAAALATLRGLPQVRHAAAVDRAELASLLRPWLGSDGADPDLPIPAMIDADLRVTDAAALAQVRAAVLAAAPSARIDRQESWMSPVADFMDMVTGLALALVLLMAAATAAVVILAARAGLETHNDTIEVLHMLGSTDIQVSRLFQRRIALDTLLGGALGAVFAGGVIVLVGSQLGLLGSDLIGGMTLATGDWIALALLPLAFAMLATLAARVAITAALSKIL